MKHRVVVLAFALLLSACSDPISTSTTASNATTTTAPAVTTTDAVTTTAPPSMEAVTTYFFENSGGNGARPGPFLVAVSDTVASSEDRARDVLTALVDGPPSAAVAAGISTAIPDGTSVIDVSVGSDGVATVELSGEFDDGGGSFSVLGRLAQLTYTLTALDGVESVLLMENGSVVETFSGEGVVLDGPMVRDDFLDVVPGILVESPAWGAEVSLPFEAVGVAAAFEAVFQAELLVDGEPVFSPPFVMTDNGVGWGSFAFEIDADTDVPSVAVLRVWEFSAKDGSVISERFVPVNLVASS